MSFNYHYNYQLFLKDANLLVNQSNNLFKLCLATTKDNILEFYYIKANLNIINDKYNLEMYIIFSETYQLPVLYFNIYINEVEDNEENCSSCCSAQIINYEELKKKEEISSDMVRYCEISRENNPYTGIVCEYLHLCQLNQLLNSLKDINNILYFWLSIVLQIFNVDLTKLVILSKKNI